MKKDDARLVEEYLNGDTYAFRALIQRYLASVFGVAFRLVGNQHDAEDITQHTFTKAWKSLNSFDPTGSFKAWILSIARNSAIDFLRAKKVVLFSDLDEEDAAFSDSLVDQTPFPDELFDNKELRQKLNNALLQLPMLYRSVIVLHVFEQLTFDEIAIATKKPLNTIKSQYRRGVELLRSFLTDAPK